MNTICVNEGHKYYYGLNMFISINQNKRVIIMRYLEVKGGTNDADDTVHSIFQEEMVKYVETCL